MANIQEPIRTVKSLQGQILQRDETLTVADVDNERVFQSGSGEIHLDISSQTYKCTKDYVRSLGNVNPLVTYVTPYNDIESRWRVDLEDTTTPDDDYTCIVTVTGVRLKRIIEDYYNALTFGADRFGLTDSMPALQRAVDYAADHNGGTVLIPNGKFRFDSGVVINGSGIYIKALGKQGKQFASVPDRDRGTYIFPGSDMSTDSLFKFTVAPSGLPNRSCGIIDISFIGGADGAFFYPVDSAVRVARSDQFTMQGCTFERIQGRAVHVSGTIKSCLTDIDVFQSGAAGKPAVDIGEIEGPVQGSFFDKFRVESCFSTYVKVVSAMACIYDNFVFETAPGASTQHLLLDFGGTSSQFGKCRFNKTDSTSAFNKAIISGNGNKFDSMLFDGGHSDTESALLVTGQGNTINVTSDGGTNISASVEMLGNYNTLDASIRFSGGVIVSGVMNTARVRQVSSSYESVLSGTDCSLEINIDVNLTAGYPLIISGTRCKVIPTITDCTNAAAAILQTGNANRISEISIRNCPNGIEIDGGTYIGSYLMADVAGQEFIFTSGNIISMVDQIRSGATVNRPVSPPVVGFGFFDTTLGNQIYWDGTKWVEPLTPTQSEITGTDIDFTIDGARFKDITADLTLTTSNPIAGKPVEIHIDNNDVAPHTVTITGAPFPIGANNEIPAGGRAHISLMQINGIMDASIVIYS